MLEELYKAITETQPGTRLLDKVKTVVEKYNWSIDNYRLVSPEGKRYHLTMKNKEMRLCRSK